jgi:hypothetical protein
MFAGVMDRLGYLKRKARRAATRLGHDLGLFHTFGAKGQEVLFGMQRHAVCRAVRERSGRHDCDPGQAHLAVAKCVRCGCKVVAAACGDIVLGSAV